MSKEKDRKTSEAPTPVVYLVDDNEDVLETLRDQLMTIGLGAELHASGRAFLNSLSAGAHGCVVLDLRMPEVGGLTVVEALVKAGVRLPIVLYSGHVDVDAAVVAMKFGCFDVITKGSSTERLLNVVQKAIERDRERLVEQARRSQADARLSLLTRREREVAKLVVLGKRNKEIAFDLGIASGTVEIHRGRIMRKLGANSVAELIHITLASGF